MNFSGIVLGTAVRADASGASAVMPRASSRADAQQGRVRNRVETRLDIHHLSRGWTAASAGGMGAHGAEGCGVIMAVNMTLV
ncbi:hypothetical protein GCM10017744_097070 [Streptomyces antimycoticus]|uniref:Uncharacterized protein n=1 Tax=Streptomyces antimycoticus TaxID=68175 RepID=A0A4D4JWG6_9ACTN|nr:hypothetical protein SANT12839_009240 [Streptomyces antimycoticus]